MSPAMTSLTKAEQRALVAALRAPINTTRRCILVGGGKAEQFKRCTIDALTERGLLSARPAPTLRTLSPAGREIAERLKAEMHA